MNFTGRTHQSKVFIGGRCGGLLRAHAVVYCAWMCNADQSKQMDIIFVIPISSSNIFQQQYNYILLFVSNVTRGLDIDSGNVRVGVIAYPPCPFGQFYLRDYVNRREALLAALRLFNPGGSVRSSCAAHCALNQVRNTHFTAPYGARSDARKVVRLFFDFVVGDYVSENDLRWRIGKQGRRQLTFQMILYDSNNRWNSRWICTG